MIDAYKTLFPATKYLSDNKIKKKILKDKLFASEFLQKEKIDNRLKHSLDLLVTHFLASRYIELVKKSNEPNETVLRSFYEVYKDSLKPPKSVDISTIKVPSLEEADKIYLTLKKDPQKFDQLAREKSKDSQIHYKNVPITFFNPEIREWIRNHKQGDISTPFHIAPFYYIDRIDKIYDTNASYESLLPTMKQLLKNLYISNRLDRLYQQLKEKYQK